MPTEQVTATDHEIEQLNHVEHHYKGHWPSCRLRSGCGRNVLSHSQRKAGHCKGISHAV